MPRLPMLAGAIPQRLVTDTFAGYNHNLKIADGEFFDTKNLTTAQFPMLANRGKRGVLTGIGGHSFIGLRAIIKKNGMYWVETETVNGNDVGVLYANGDRIAGLSDLQTADETQLVSMGAYICIFPDGKYFNTMDHSDFGDMGASLTLTNVTVSYQMCHQDGTPYENVEWKQPTAPGDPSGGDVWIDTSENVAKQWSEYTNSWTTIETIYTRVQFSTMGDIPRYFKEHDGVQISGLKYSDLNGSKIIYAVGGSAASSSGSGSLTPADTFDSPEGETEEVGTESPSEPVEESEGDPNSQGSSGDESPSGSWEEQEPSNASGLIEAETFGSAEGEQDYIVLAGVLQKNSGDNVSTVTIERKIPQMQYVCEAQNRLWGCFYGNIPGKGNINELYCCALGDFKNWEQYLGVSTDSWRASCGSDGAWTGCINYLGSPTFFKENRIHPISVSSVGAHQVGDLPARGVQNGSSKSLAIVNETLYYKTRSGVVAWQGGMPVDVGAALGDVRYYEAAAGVFGQRYYISMRDSANVWSFFCYDVHTGIWMREDELHAEGFTVWGDELYAKAGNTIVTINGTEGTKENRVDWYAETGVLYYELPDHKYVSHFNIRLKMERGARMQLFIEYDSSGIWEHSGEIRVLNINSFTIPVRPRRCDHLRIKLVGEGDAKVFSVARILERGSDV
ncbi:MAG: hypothetical protein IJI06_08665 [Oscillospiraceae bacterium]|nr:hypothetical protein [Oscillospiraceae bacterium]